MEFVLVLFSVGAGAAAGYLASDRRASDTATPTAFGAALFGVVLYLIVPEEAQPGRVSLRTRNAPPAVVTGSGLNFGAEREAARGASLAGKSVLTATLVDTGRNQIALIKVLRNYLDIGLKDAKDPSDAAKRGGRPSWRENSRSNAHGNLPATSRTQAGW